MSDTFAEADDPARRLGCGEDQRVDSDLVEEVLEDAVVEDPGVVPLRPEAAQLGLERRTRLVEEPQQPARLAAVVEGERARRGEDEVRPERADVEPDRPVEGELAVERAGRSGFALPGLSHQDGPGVQVAVQQRLGLGHEGDLRAPDATADHRVLGQSADVVRQLRR